MKKILLSAVVVISFTAYSVSEKSQATQRVLVVPPRSLHNNQDNSPPNITYKDGEYEGEIADAFYGNLQVKVIINEGKISDIIFMQYPYQRQTSVEINEAAIPYLKQEAILSQSGEVDTITGATQSSEAFKKSLKSALDKSKG